MSTSLRRAIESGDYLVDANAVADAILRRAWARSRARAAHPASEVLVPAQLPQSSFTEPSQPDPLSLDDST